MKSLSSCRHSGLGHTKKPTVSSLIIEITLFSLEEQKIPPG